MASPSALSVAVRVQHHPSREELIPRLLDALDGFDDVRVVADPEPEGKTNAWAAHRATLEAMPGDATHLLVIQDDALPCQHFASRLLAAVERRPESVLLAFVPGFKTERRLMQMAQKARADVCAFIVGSYVPTVAIIYPRAVVDGLLAWADSTHRDGMRRPLRGADDGILQHYCRRHRIYPLALVPCLVEHDELVESIGKKHRPGPHRRAALL